MHNAVHFLEDIAMNKSENKNKRQTALFIARLVASMAVAWLTLPMVIRQVTPGLDPSWHYILNIAGTKGLKFGTDIVFTYGPLGFVCSAMNFGNNIAITAAVYIFAVLLLVFMLIGALRRFEGKGWIVPLISFFLL